jgi:hypothetical protein
VAGGERQRGATVSLLGTGKVGRESLISWGGSLPHDRAPAAHGRRQGAVERWHGGRPRHNGSGGGASSRAARILGDGSCSLRGKTLGHRRYL